MTEYTVPRQLDPERLLKPNPDSFSMFGSWVRNPIKQRRLREEFKASTDSPFPHVVIEDFLDASVLEKLLGLFPSSSSAVWHPYNNPLELKLSCNNLDTLPIEFTDLFYNLNSPDVIKLMADITEADPFMHGGGLHCHPPGGKLDIHLDYMVHPLLQSKERRLNLIIYLNKDWTPGNGGELELWDKDLSRCEVKVAPRWNRGVLFQTSDISYHGLPDPIIGYERQSMANYYVSPLRPGATHRYKAKFFARPTDPQSEALDKLREIRANRRITEEDLKEVGLSSK